MTRVGSSLKDARPSSGVIIHPRGRCDEHGDSIAEE